MQSLLASASSNGEVRYFGFGVVAFSYPRQESMVKMAVAICAGKL